jgi:benzoyl-CoA reductase subunit B
LAKISLGKEMAEKKYKTKPFDCWNKAKELRMNHYRDYAEAHEKGGLRWTAGSLSYDAIPAGLGDDIYCLAAEPYGASVATVPPFQIKCQEAIEGKGWARDLCAYMRSYWGSIVRNEYFFGGEWPRPDFIFQNHICCVHAKWDQVVAADLEPGVPYFCFDFAAAPYTKVGERQIDYVAGQLHDGIEFLEKTTGRKYDDEKLIQAVYNTFRSCCLWAQVCELNQNIPAPMDEKSMYSFYVLGNLQKSKKEIADFYPLLLDEVKDRVANQIAAVGNERCRVMTDHQPPWAFLKIWRYYEKYGVVSIGSTYTFSLCGWWDIDEEGKLVPMKTLEEQEIKIKDRDHALRLLAEADLKGKKVLSSFYGAELKSDIMIKIANQWHCDAVIIHLNRGCEGGAVHQLENKRALMEAGFPVLAYEGNMADEREFDLARTTKLVDIFFTETLGLKRLEE